MPSPFPGMDPYLERPARWAGVHQRLITHLADGLNTLLPPHYVADIGERLFPVEMREVFVQILPVDDQSRIVTAIEVLSASNKTAGSDGRELYLTKQQEVLRSDTHLIEIDLLRQGAHTVAAPIPALQARGRWDYLVCLHRAGAGRQFEVWPITLRQALPTIRVPLANGDPDVEVNLQAVFNRCYDEGGYARRLDYREEPPVPLSPDDAAWADALLRQAGLRAP